MTSTFWLLLVVCFCQGMSFFLSGMEAGVLALNRLRVRQQMHAGNGAARLLHSYLEKPEDFLWTILVGNALANFAVVSLIVYLLHQWVGDRPWLLLLVLVVVVFVLYAVGELLPKMLFRQAPNRLCLRVARPFGLAHLALSPLVAMVAWLAGFLLRWTGGRRFTGRLFGNREELRLVMQESSQALTTEEQAMVNRVLDLQNLTVGHIAVPLRKVVTVASETPITEFFRTCREGGWSRLPVRQRERQRIVGIVSLRTSLYRTELDLKATVGDFLQPALFLDESMRLEAALQRLQKTGQRMAIVLGPDRKEMGIITLEDILHSVFGNVSL